MTAKKKRKLSIWLTVALIMAIAVLGVLKIPGLWTEVTFYWYDHTETELKVKAYAEEMGAPALPGSGRQEYLEAVVNNILFHG